MTKHPCNPSRRTFLLGGLNKIRARLDSAATDNAAYSLSPGSKNPVSPAQARQVKKLFILGNRAYDSMDYEQAVRQYEQCLELAPRHGEARKRLGYCLYRLEKYIQASLAFRRVLREQQQDNFSSLFLGLTYARLKQPAQAVEALRGYYNPSEVHIMREINVQTALLESSQEPCLESAIANIEQAINSRKTELLTDSCPTAASD